LVFNKIMSTIQRWNIYVIKKMVALEVERKVEFYIENNTF